MSEHLPPITPPPVPMRGGRVDAGVSRVLVLGGSFDPVHRAHVNIPLVVRRELERVSGVTELLYVPAARSPHKAAGPRASDAERVAMLRLATGHLPHVGVWTDEIDRAGRGGGGPSYTIDTVRRLRAWLDAHGGESVACSLLIGADQAAAFHTWREPREILRLASPVVMLRGGDGDTLTRRLGEASFWSHSEIETWRRGIIPVGTMDIASTAVRGALASGGEGADALLVRSLDPRVLAYIRAHGLYR